jgi:tumor protein p53-inducible protein 3
MKAVLLSEHGPVENLYLGETKTPEPGPGQIRVKVAATALNRADLLQREGKYPAPAGESPILGLEIAGTVDKLGPGSTRWQQGQRVFGLLAGGGYAEYALIDENLAWPTPQTWSFAEAAAIPEAFLTAYQSLVSIAKVQATEKVLVHAGASGVGTAAIQLLKALGAEVAVTASASKHDLCHKLGADLCIDYRQNDFVQACQDWSHGNGVAVVLDFLGAQYWQKNLEVLGMDGRLVILALMGGAKITESNLSHILRKRLMIQGSTLRNRSLDYKIKLAQDFWAFAEPLFANKSFKPVIDQILPWTEVQAAHQRMEQNLNAGKIVLTLD